MYAREGVEMERSTLADWVGGASRLLRPLVDALQRHVMAGAKLHADDTGSCQQTCRVSSSSFL
jgi:transposase